MSLEQTLTDSRLFALPATPVQRAICRAADGIALGELANDPEVVHCFGGPKAIAALPVGEYPKRIDVVCPIRAGKSIMAASAAWDMSQRVDVAMLRQGEVPRVVLLAPDKDKADVVFTHLVNSVMTRPLMRSIVVGDPTSDTIVVRHPSGHHIEIVVSAVGRAGGALVSRWLAGLIVDEAPRMLPAAEDFVFNLEDSLAAAEGRLLPGAQEWLIGSPWAPWGEVYDSVTKRFAHPGPDRIVCRPRAAAMNPVWWTESRIAHIKATNPRAYRSDVLAEFVEGAASAFDPEDIEAAFKPRDLKDFARASKPIIYVDAAGHGKCTFAWSVGQWLYPKPIGTPYVMTPTLDPNPGHGDRYLKPVPGSFSPKRDPVTGERMLNPDYVANPAPVFAVRAIGGFDKEAREHIGAEGVVNFFQYELGQEFGTREIRGDQFGDWALKGLIRSAGGHFDSITVGPGNKRHAVDWIRRLMKDRRLWLAEHDGMRRELLGFSEIPTSGGGTKYAGRTTDYLATLITAAIFDAQGDMPGAPGTAQGGRTDYGPGDFGGN